MAGKIIVGLQWGDEGKGKIVDLLSSEASHIVRSQGGNNAGHTIFAEQGEVALHLIPSGILHPQTRCYIAGGCMIDPEILVKEIQEIKNLGISLEERLFISPYAQIIFPFHRLLDQCWEKRRGSQAIGTTGRGIGPCAVDRAARRGLRLGELVDEKIFDQRFLMLCEVKDLELQKLFEQEPLDQNKFLEEQKKWGRQLAPYVNHVEMQIQQALLREETVLFEGAHGTFLDTIYGSYPFVTSSSTLAGGICAGAGIGPCQIDEVVGVLKSYTTRVGSGPLPTQVDPDSLQDFHANKEFREIGSTTGRERRIGWLDLVLARCALRLNGVTQIALTKLDVLDHLPEIRLCVGYHIEGKSQDFPPPVIEDWQKIEPIYKTVPGWLTSTKEVENIRKLPKNARNFIDTIEEYCNVPISMVSVGPKRMQTIMIDEEWM